MENKGISKKIIITLRINVDFFNQFAQDVQQGLSASAKYLSSKYFYDTVGSQLFQNIMELPEYYLTACEYEILQTHQTELGKYLAAGVDGFELLELGAGDGLKTKILLRNFLQNNYHFRYLPVDISPSALHNLTEDLHKNLPNLTVQPLVSEYFVALSQLPASADTRKVVLFLGSNLGNFNHTQALFFLQSLRQGLQKGDLLLIGLDLQKQPDLILAAYNDSQGVTKAFNLNLLQRINRELGANFDLANFMHYPLYDPYEGCAKSFIISKLAQEIYIEQLACRFELGAWEAIHTEVSYKYTLSGIAQLARQSGFVVKQNFLDHRSYFCDSLWEAI
ncbi:MAG: L-histidine N(alpha)-methyltransferase [Microscillaceae bacterium]|jgi:dimethylhistidine N-methyltransferase|nr:L-histidine N(alpha)-methyltransferase [Microscillaceae bacterium]